MKDFILKCEDALAFSKNLSDNSIKLIITSPPYNIGKSYEKRTSISEYIKNFLPTLKELVRVLKDDGSICWQVGNYVENGEVYPLDIFFYNCFISHLISVLLYSKYCLVLYLFPNMLLLLNYKY